MVELHTFKNQVYNIANLGPTNSYSLKYASLAVILSAGKQFMKIIAFIHDKMQFKYSLISINLIFKSLKNTLSQWTIVRELPTLFKICRVNGVVVYIT